jgi:hypothetical protein
VARLRGRSRTSRITAPHCRGSVPVVRRAALSVGSLDVGGATVEVRNALEPWHVLGEQTTATGTARYVDSSMERLEIRTVGLDPERYAVAINRFALPTRAGAGRDVRVGGVVPRVVPAARAASALASIIRCTSTSSTPGRSARAGGAYHVWHPEGRGFDAAPLTRVEAAARRVERFTLEGPSPWPLYARPTTPHPDQPYTLDLRRVDAGHPMPRPEDWPEDKRDARRPRRGCRGARRADRAARCRDLDRCRADVHARTPPSPRGTRSRGRARPRASTGVRARGLPPRRVDEPRFGRQFPDEPAPRFTFGVR